MATELEAQRLRRRLGYQFDDVVSLPQAEVDEVFEQAAVRYTNSQSIEVYAAIVYLEGLLVNSAKMNSFKKNQTTENASDLFSHVKDLISYYNSDLAMMESAAAGTEGTVRSGKTISRARKNSVYWWEEE